MSSYVEQHTITKVHNVKNKNKNHKTLMKHRNKIIYQDLKHVKTTKRYLLKDDSKQRQTEIQDKLN